MPQKVFVTRQIPEVGLKMLREKGYEVDVYPKDRVPSQRELVKYFRKKPYDAIITLLTDKVDKTLFDASPSTKIFANYAIGFDNMDIEQAKARGVFVTNAPGDYEGCVEEHAMGMMLNLSTRMSEGDRYIRKGKYKGWAPMVLIGTDMRGKTLGLIGAGHIGEYLGLHAARGFEMKVVYYDVVKNEKLEKEVGATFVENVEDAIRQADYVSLHVPLLDSTRHLMNEARLKMMKREAFLINTSRGPVVDENALVAALQNGVIKGAGLDVFEFEPKLAKGLAKLENVILTPHIASARESARNEMATVAAQNVIDCLEGREPRNAVKPKA